MENDSGHPAIRSISEVIRKIQESPRDWSDERAFRRGYLHGYLDALRVLEPDVRELPIWERIQAFALGRLQDWREEEDLSSGAPPKFSRKNDNKAF